MEPFLSCMADAFPGSYSNIADSLTAKAAAKYLKDTKTSIIVGDKQLQDVPSTASNSQQYTKVEAKIKKVQLTNLEKVAVVCVSGTGSEILNRPWTNLPM